MKTLRTAALAGSLLCAAFHSAAAREGLVPDSAPPASGAFFVFPVNTKPQDLGKRLSAYYTFCDNYPGECLNIPRTENIIQLNPENWNRLVAVYNHVRAHMKLVEDFREYPPSGRQDENGNELAADVWTHGETGRGDCEDWALRWRKEMVEAGFPAGALLLTFLQNNETEQLTVNGVTKTFKQGHLVLTIRTDRGDLVADMLKDKLYSVADLTKEWSIELVESPFNMTHFYKPGIRTPAPVIQVSGGPVPLQIR